MKHILFVFILVCHLKRLECLNICMTWKSRHRQLIINCKVERLHFEVSIFGPSSNLQAHCLSPTHNINCTSFNNDGHVEQILQTNTTIFTVYDRDISRFNGIWTCQHGSRKDEISTEVTITKVLQNVTRDQVCYEKFLTWTMIGFVPTFITFRILVWSVAFISKMKEQATKSVLSLCPCIGSKQIDSTIVCRRVVIILISSYFFIMPFVVGLMEKSRCKAPTLFSLAGVICGLLINCVWSEEKELQNNNRNDSMQVREEATVRLQEESV